MPFYEGGGAKALIPVPLRRPEVDVRRGYGGSTQFGFLPRMLILPRTVHFRVRTYAHAYGNVTE